LNKNTSLVRRRRDRRACALRGERLTSELGHIFESGAVRGRIGAHVRQADRRMAATSLA
jgi:hypothetical protein